MEKQLRMQSWKEDLERGVHLPEWLQVWVDYAGAGTAVRDSCPGQIILKQSDTVKNLRSAESNHHTVSPTSSASQHLTKGTEVDQMSENKGIWGWEWCLTEDEPAEREAVCLGVSLFVYAVFFLIIRFNNAKFVFLVKLNQWKFLESRLLWLWQSIMAYFCGEDKSTVKKEQRSVFPPFKGTFPSTLNMWLICKKLKNLGFSWAICNWRTLYA